jgi:type I restriction enzyme S subunit
MTVLSAEFVVRRLKHAATISVSNVDKKSSDGEVPIRLCNYTDVYYNEAITAELPFMTATATPEQIRRFALRAGDVLITKDSETPDDIAVPAFVPDSLPGVACGYHLAVIRADPGLLYPKFLYWSMSSTFVRQGLGAEATGVTRFGLRVDAIANVRLRLPSLEQQRRIARMLDSETARIDGVARRLGGGADSPPQSMCGLLMERRRALVNSAVTGGLDVAKAAT